MSLILHARHFIRTRAWNDRPARIVNIISRVSARSTPTRDTNDTPRRAAKRRPRLRRRRRGEYFFALPALAPFPLTMTLSTKVNVYLREHFAATFAPTSKARQAVRWGKKEREIIPCMTSRSANDTRFTRAFHRACLRVGPEEETRERRIIKASEALKCFARVLEV